MRIATVHEMMLTMTDMFPATFSTPRLIASWEPQYRASLSRLEGDDLNSAWHACMDGWTKKAAPSPADFLKAHLARPNNTPTSNSNGKVISFAKKLEERDRLRNEDRRALIDRYERDHTTGYALARSEGWIGQLNEQVKRSANIIAQRNEQRRSGIQVADWKPEFSEDNRSESFVPWCSIVTHEGVDLIEIEQGTLKVWRAQALIPGPGMKPVKQTAVQNVGFQSVETSSAA